MCGCHDLWSFRSGQVCSLDGHLGNSLGRRPSSAAQGGGASSRATVLNARL